MTVPPLVRLASAVAAAVNQRGREASLCVPGRGDSSSLPNAGANLWLRFTGFIIAAPGRRPS